MNNQSKRRNHRDGRSILLILALCMTALAQGGHSFTIADEKAAAKPAPVHTIAVTSAMVDAYAAADARVGAARKAVEISPVWKDYIIAQNQQQTTLIAIMAESGIKPSEMADPGPPAREGCRAVIEDSKLIRFDCPVKEPAKIKP
jgi:hypothetical protein